MSRRAEFASLELRHQPRNSREGPCGRDKRQEKRGISGCFRKMRTRAALRGEAADQDEVQHRRTERIRNGSLIIGNDSEQVN